MFYSCFMCRKIKWGKYEELKYTALNGESLPEVYTKKLCPSCGDDIEEFGHLDDYIQEREES